MNNSRHYQPSAYKYPNGRQWIIIHAIPVFRCTKTTMSPLNHIGENCKTTAPVDTDQRSSSTKTSDLPVSTNRQNPISHRICKRNVLEQIKRKTSPKAPISGSRRKIRDLFVSFWTEAMDHRGAARRLAVNSHAAGLRSHPAEFKSRRQNHARGTSTHPRRPLLVGSPRVDQYRHRRQLRVTPCAATVTGCETDTTCPGGSHS